MNDRVEPDIIERRLDKPYDDQWPGHVLGPNHRPVDSGDREFLAAAERAALALHDVRWR